MKNLDCTKRGAKMDLKNYQLSEYEEYLLKRTGTENVSFIDGMVYATYHPESNTTELMKTNDDEFVPLCIEAEEQMKPLQMDNILNYSKRHK